MMRFGWIHLPYFTPLVLVITAVGCTAKYTVPVSDQGRPQYTHLLVTYDQAPHDIRVANHVIHANAAPPADVPKVQTASQLRIEFPHPEGRAGYGLATLTHAGSHTPNTGSVWWHGRNLTTPEMLVESGRSTSATRSRPITNAASNSDGNSGPSVSQVSAGHRTTWLLDISRERLDQLLVACADSGFFDEAKQPTGAAHIAFQIDSGRSAKHWKAHPALDDLASEVSRRGCLVGPNTPLPGSPAR